MGLNQFERATWANLRRMINRAVLLALALPFGMVRTAWAIGHSSRMTRGSTRNRRQFSKWTFASPLNPASIRVMLPLPARSIFDAAAPVITERASGPVELNLALLDLSLIATYGGRDRRLRSRPRAANGAA